MSWPVLLDPWFLCAIPALLLAAWWRWRRPAAALPTADASLLGGLPRTWRVRLRWLPLWGKVAAGIVLCVALARPVERDVAPLHEQGIDILLVVDQSSSMRIDDMAGAGVERIAVARDCAAAFAAERTHDRVGLVTFSRVPELRCPLTLDERALGAFVRSIVRLPEGDPLDGTAIGLALTKARAVLEGGDAASKVVVLLTDGDETLRTVPILDGAKLCADAGIRVHTIGIGTFAHDNFGRRVRIDFSRLAKVAELTGGRFFEAQSAAQLAQVYAEIDRLETRELEDPRYRTVDRFAWPLLCGGALLILVLLLEALWLRGVP